LRPKLGLWWRRRGHAVELGGGGHGRRNSGDRTARSEQHTAQGGIGVPRDKVGAVGGGGTGWNHVLTVGAPMAGWRTGRRHRRCSSARGRVTSLYRWHACSLSTGGRTGGGASGERSTGRHRSDRGSRRGGTATRSARRPRHAREHGEGAAWEGGSSGGARAGTDATCRTGDV
jgi:hypothetical protein